MIGAKRNAFPVLGCLGVLIALVSAFGQVPGVMNHQGRILRNNRGLDGAAQFKFALVNSTGTESYWRNSVDANSDGEPDRSVTLSVSRGLYSVLLGDTNLTDMAMLPPAVFTNATLFLRIWFNDGVASFERLIPDQQVAAVGYAIMAGTVPDASLTAAKFAPGALVASNLNGALIPAQIPDLDATKITSGLLHTNRIPNLDASQIASGSLSTNRIPPLDASHIESGTFAPTRIPVLDAAVIGTGVLNAARLPGLSATQITSGVLDTARFPLLDASQIGAGTLDANRIPGLDAEKITSGTLNAARLPGIDGAQITSGTFSSARIPPLNANQITAGTLNPNLIPALDAGSIASGTFPAARLPANVAYTDPHISGLSAQIANLTAQVNALSGGAGSLPAGAAIVSSQVNDPVLMASGFEVFMNVPSPSWSTSSAADGLTARLEHAAVWSPGLGKMFAWGGQLGANTFSETGGLYESASDSWQPITTAGAPSARRGHSMIFDGVKEALIWGGFTEVGYANSGARFDLELGSWTPMSTVGAPAGRDGHAAAWLNSAMVIWGGRNSTGPLGDGAIYSRGTDQWSAVPAANAPSARFGASAVTAGNRVLIWGGTGIGGALNTGAQLEFPLGSAAPPSGWNTITTLNAPTARTGHAAVWTGSRMIVWGGRNGGTFLGDGALFDPNTGAWTPITSVGAPVARADASVVWTGQEMLMFGGETPGGATATGAAYNPATNRWRPLSSAGNPAARSGASAVWTGSELILFGGQSGASPVAALQRLAPQPTWYFYRKL